MQTKVLIAGLALSLAAVPVLAGPIVVSPQLLLRDSDGIVISVLHPVDYGPIPGGVGPGGVYYTFNGEVVPMTGGVTAGVSSPTAGPTMEIGGATYQVEASGGEVWLRDLATGQRYAAEKRIAAIAPDAVGLKVNPNAFALD